MKPRAQYGTPSRTLAQRRSLVTQILAARDDLDGIVIESFCRSHDLREDQARGMIADEKRRRAKL